MKKSARPQKVIDKKLGQFNGLKVYVRLEKPKRRGKARVQIHICQDDGYDWHVEQCLNYSRTLYVLFATDTIRNSDGLIV